MYNQELCDKVDALYESGDYEAVVSLVENLPDNEKTPSAFPPGWPGPPEWG